MSAGRSTKLEDMWWLLLLYCCSRGENCYGEEDGEGKMDTTVTKSPTTSPPANLGAVCSFFCLIDPKTMKHKELADRNWTEVGAINLCIPQQALFAPSERKSPPCRRRKGRISIT